MCLGQFSFFGLILFEACLFFLKQKNQLFFSVFSKEITNQLGYLSCSLLGLDQKVLVISLKLSESEEELPNTVAISSFSEKVTIFDQLIQFIAYLLSNLQYNLHISNIMSKNIVDVKKKFLQKLLKDPIFESQKIPLNKHEIQQKLTYTSKLYLTRLFLSKKGKKIAYNCQVQTSQQMN